MRVDWTEHGLACSSIDAAEADGSMRPARSQERATCRRTLVTQNSGDSIINGSNFRRADPSPATEH